MNVHNSNVWLLGIVLGSACGGKDKLPAKDDAGTGDAGLGDASLAKNTDVTGTLGGVSFDLKYAAVKFAIPGDPRNWVCAADIPVTYAVCQQAGSPARVMLLGAFVYDQNGNPKWDLAETAMYRVGSNALTELANSGSLNILNADAVSGSLSLTLSLNIGEQPQTTGHIVTP